MQRTPQTHETALLQAIAQREAKQGSGGLSAQLTRSPRQVAQRQQLEDLQAAPLQRHGLRAQAPAKVVVQLKLNEEDVGRAIQAAIEHWEAVFHHISASDRDAIRKKANQLNDNGNFKRYNALATELKAWIDTKALERKQAKETEHKTRNVPEVKPVVDPENKAEKHIPSAALTGADPQPKGPTEEKKKPKDKRGKTEVKLSLDDFLRQTKDRNMWESGDDTKVKTKVESAPRSTSAMLPDYSKIDRTADVRAKLDTFDPALKKQGGAKGGGLNVEEVRAIIKHAKPMTKFPYVLKGEGSGDYKTRLQLKFITHVKSSPSNITFHLSITQEVFDALTEIVEGDAK